MEVSMASITDPECLLTMNSVWVSSLHLWKRMEHVRRWNGNQDDEELKLHNIWHCCQNCNWVSVFFVSKACC